MKINRILLSGLLLTFIIVSPVSSIAENNPNNDGAFQIIFWAGYVLDMEVLKESTYSELVSKYENELEILSDEYILKYYWDEQLIEFEYYRYRDDTGQFLSTGEGLFSIAINKNFIFHGLCRTGGIGPIKQKYDDRDYPAIIRQFSADTQTSMLALQSKYNSNENLFRDYDENEQLTILNQEVLKFF